MEDEALEQSLRGVATHCTDDQSIDNADVMLKLAMAVGIPGLSAEIGEAFTGLICCFVCGARAEHHDGGSDAAILRMHLQDLCRVLSEAIEPPRDAEAQHRPLCMATVDLLRTSAFCLAKCEGTDLEYTRNRRSEEVYQQRGRLWHILRNPNISHGQRQAYATAEAMHHNHREGLAALQALSERSDEELNSFMNSACRNLCSNLECMCVPILFDGQRLRAGLEIASTLFGAHEGSFGVDFIANHFMNASGSLMSLVRVQTSACVLMAMAKIHPSVESDAKRDALLSAIDTFLETLREALEAKLGQHRRDAPGSVAGVLECVANWFESALHDDDSYRIIKSAFQAPVLVLGECSALLKRLWREFRCTHGVGAVNLWTAVQFVCTARAKIHGTGMCISTAVHVVLSGVVGNCVCGEECCGPFMLNQPTKLVAVVYYRRLPKVVYKLPRCSGAEESPVADRGNDCKETRIIKELLALGTVRAQHQKSASISETRLWASLLMLSMRESLTRNLPSHVSAAPSEGRKDLRRLWILYLQTLPYMKHSRCQHADAGSCLIERCRKGDNGRTTRDNVEKPWRDVLGGSVIATLLYPVAGEAFMYAIENLAEDGKFTSTTNNCVDEFAHYMRRFANTTFDPKKAMASVSHRAEGHEYTSVVFAQQRAFVHAYCNAIKHTGALWEAMQLTFSTHGPRDDDEREENAQHKRKASSEPDSPSLTYRVSAPDAPRPTRAVA